MTLYGAREFRARLEAIRHTGESVARAWAEEGEADVRAAIPRDTGETAGSVRGDATMDGATITAGGAIVYLMGGTAAHVEEPSAKQAMKFDVAGRTIFSKRVYHPATPANSRIADAARNALGSFSAALYRLWNGAA